MLTGNVAVTVHGRYLHEERDSGLLLVGFHGYAETADVHMAELQKIPRIERWSLAAVQALHPFYTRSGQVVASWMTSLDRDLAIADNIAYVKSVLAALPSPRRLVFAGFSQGVPMAARAAAHVAPAAGLVMLGGDLPPEIRADASIRFPPVLVGRGTRDEWYTEEKFRADLGYLDPKTRVTRCVYAGGHEWTDPFREAVADFLAAIE